MKFNLYFDKNDTALFESDSSKHANDDVFPTVPKKKKKEKRHPKMLPQFNLRLSGFVVKCSNTVEALTSFSFWLMREWFFHSTKFICLSSEAMIFAVINAILTIA